MKGQLCSISLLKCKILGEKCATKTGWMFLPTGEVGQWKTKNFAAVFTVLSMTRHGKYPRSLYMFSYLFKAH